MSSSDIERNLKQSRIRYANTEDVQRETGSSSLQSSKAIKNGQSTNKNEKVTETPPSSRPARLGLDIDSSKYKNKFMCNLHIICLFQVQFDLLGYSTILDSLSLMYWVAALLFDIFILQREVAYISFYIPLHIFILFLPRFCQIISITHNNITIDTFCFI